MTDERLQREIEYYIPGDPDPSLDVGEYYYLQYTARGERVIRVFALDILPHKDGTEYGIYMQKGARLCRVDVGWGDDPSRGCRKSDLYDNRQDCKDQTHMGCSWWEDLRKKQREMMKG